MLLNWNYRIHCILNPILFRRTITRQIKTESEEEKAMDIDIVQQQQQQQQNEAKDNNDERPSIVSMIIDLKAYGTPIQI